MTVAAKAKDILSSHRLPRLVCAVYGTPSGDTGCESRGFQATTQGGKQRLIARDSPSRGAKAGDSTRQWTRMELNAVSNMPFLSRCA